VLATAYNIGLAPFAFVGRAGGGAILQLIEIPEAKKSAIEE
jgi:hypothetical protein